MHTFDELCGHLRPRPSPLERITHPAATAARVELYCKRDDLYSLAPGTALQGNKVRKLLPLLEKALARKKPPLLVSFGGAYSNHLSALATAGRCYDLPVVIYVRGEEVDNPLLDQARADGAQLIPISRTEYRSKNDPIWLEQQRGNLAQTYGYAPTDIWFIPEGGTYHAGVTNVGGLYHEIVAQLSKTPDYICLSAGTGGTAAGLIQAAAPATQFEVFPALKGDWMQEEIARWLPPTTSVIWRCITNYHFGGYGKFPKEWIRPASGLATRAQLEHEGLPPLEPIYSAKLFYGVLDRLRAGHYQPESQVVVLHCGGIY
ncbi:MAG: pyridoxal-phosphate dependent enzyme [Bacteroidota bacterium]